MCLQLNSCYGVENHTVTHTQKADRRSTTPVVAVCGVGCCFKYKFRRGFSWKLHTAGGRDRFCRVEEQHIDDGREWRRTLTISFLCVWHALLYAEQWRRKQLTCILDSITCYPTMLLMPYSPCHSQQIMTRAPCGHTLDTIPVQLGMNTWEQKQRNKGPESQLFPP